MGTLDDDWNIFKDTLLNSAKEVCGTKMIGSRQKQTLGWTEDVKKYWIKIRHIDSG